MLILWRGFGFMVVLIPFLVSIIGNLISNWAVGAGYWDSHKWPTGVAMLIATPILWLVGKRLNGRPGRLMVDKASGQEVLLKKMHDLFWIKIEWWAIVTLIGGIALIVADVVKK